MRIRQYCADCTATDSNPGSRPPPGTFAEVPVDTREDYSPVIEDYE